MSFIELQTPTSINAVDGGLQPETDGDVDRFDKEADGPNRVTVWVPSERVVVNVGNAVYFTEKDKKKDQTPRMILDAGFVVETQRHVHIQTWGDGADGTDNVPARTSLRMGTHASVIQAGGTYGTQNADAANHPLLPDNAGVGSAYPLPYNTWDGYAMITEGAAYHEAYQNHMIVSASADVRLAGQRAVLVSSPGDVHIMAGAVDTTTEAIGNLDDLKGPTDYGNWITELQAWKDFDLGLTIATTAWAQVTTIVTIASEQYFRPALPGHPGWDSFGTFGDWLGFFGAIASAGVGFALACKAGADLAPDESPGSTVTLYGNASVNVYGKTNATIQSDLAVTATGAVAATLSAGLAATVSSLVSTTISGISTAVSGVATVSVTSLLGSVSVIGKSGVQLSSADKVFVAGDGDVQIDSMTSKLYMHGNKGFYLGCGSGPATPTGFAGTKYAPGKGWGLVGSTSGLDIGNIDDATDYANATSLDVNGRISFRNGQVTIGAGSSSLVFDSKGVSLQAWDDSRVLLG